jgi:cobalt-zinc-cadmium efflux system protein
LILAVIVGAEALRRLATGSARVHGMPVLVASATAALVMIVGAVILGGDVDDDPNEGSALTMRAVLLETISDAAIAGAVALVGAVILAAGGLYWLDPLVALVVALVVGDHAVVLLRRVVRTLGTGDPGSWD